MRFWRTMPLMVLAAAFVVGIGERLAAGIPSSDWLQARGIAAARGLIADATRNRAHAQVLELRAISALLEVDQMRSGALPVAEVVPIGSIRSELTPDCATLIPTNDPWGGEYYYWSSGTVFVLIATGTDRKLDRDYKALFRTARPAKALQCESNGGDLGLDSVVIDGVHCRGNDLEDLSQGLDVQNEQP